MLVITAKNSRNIFLILISMMVFAFYISPSAVVASDHKGDETQLKKHEKEKNNAEFGDHKKRRVKNENEGNELTGLTAAWLLAAANLTVFLSILLKGANRYLPLKLGTKKLHQAI